MSDLSWVRSPHGRSWHVVGLDSDRLGRVHTLCGRKWGGLGGPQPQRADTLGTGKSCETCLRLMARRVDDQVATERDGSEQP